ncbi:MAG: hypothetical protein RL238_1177 [Actinomycetota bacterium]|jgi:MFS family permease
MTVVEGRASNATIVGISLASFLVPLNSTMVAVALPHLAREFDIEKGHAGILITVYLVAMLIGQPLGGRLGDAIGVRRLAVIAVAGFGVACAASMLAVSFTMLVVTRTAQAFFAAAISPSVQAMMRVVTPPDDRGRAFGLQGSVIGVGAGLGPVIGGLLIAGFGWRAIFGVNIPIVLVVLRVLHRTVPVDAVVPPARRAPDDGSKEPVANRVFVGAFSTQAFSVVAQYALLLVTPLLLDDRGWGSGAVGASLSLLTLGMIVMSPSGGRIGDVRGRRFPVLVGLTMATVAVVGPAVVGDDVASALLLVTLAVFGVGLGMATPSILTAGVEAAPERRAGFAAGLLSMSRYVGSIVASIVLTMVVDDDGAGVGIMFIVCVVAMLAAIATATSLPGRRAEGAPVVAAAAG